MNNILDVPATIFEDPFSEEVWQSTYKDHTDMTIDDTMKRVAQYVASAEETDIKKKEWEEKFYDMLSGFKCTAGGRIYANAGTEWGGTTMMNCFVSPRLNENIDSLSAILADVLNQCQTLKSEGGWGQNFSWIRPRGTFINGIGVETPGAVKYMEIYDKTSDVITAGSGKKSDNKKAKGKIRKGAMMGVMDVWHPDIIEFITAKQQPGRLTKFNLSVNCTDEFMQKVIKILELEKLYENETTAEMRIAYEETKKEIDKWDLRFPDVRHPEYDKKWQGDIRKWEAEGLPVVVYRTVSALWLWNLIMESTYNRAEPGVLFLDRANHFGPLNYLETIYATNPSMPAGTLVHTKRGIFPIENLEDEEFEVKSLNGQWANAYCVLSGEREYLLEINLGANKNIQSTEEHRWPVYDKQTKRIYKTSAGQLVPGDLIPLNRNENMGICGDKNLSCDEGFFIGYIIGNKQKEYTNSHTINLMFKSHEQASFERILKIINTLKLVPLSIIKTDTEERCIQFNTKQLSEKLLRYGVVLETKDIPQSVWRGNDQYTKGFVDGILSSGSSVFSNDSDQRIVLTTSKKQFAQNFGKLLGFAGIPVNIQQCELNKETHDYWDVIICGRALINFYKVFDITCPKKHQLLEQAVAYVVEHEPESLLQHFAEVVSITPVEPNRVWDIRVAHDQHVFPTEWCYTGNCGEQMLAPGGVCNLGSLNLTQFIKEDRSGFDLDRIRKYTRYLNRFLDNINSLSLAPLPEYVDSMRKKRRIGIGILGWGSALFMLKVRFGSDQAEYLREEIMSTIAREAYMSSIDLAEEKGMFELCKPEKHTQGAFVCGLGLSPSYIQKLLKVGIRNSSLLSIQPTGNTSILANVVSGGLEPVFMPEYVRTVIVGSMPEEIANVCPRWFEGAWHETSMFKRAKEGDEEILKGIGPDGTVFKIDRNRGLTKEVVCQDYGVRFLAQRGEWDPKADWVVTTINLSVQDHVNDLKGFARWVDSAMSKTVNVPNEYFFEDFKNIYLESYKSGYVKGVTTYRAGTMTTVLAAKEEKNATNDDEEIIKEDVQLPDSAHAVMKTLKAEGKKWYLTVVYHENNINRPFALFVQTNSHEKNIVAEETVEVLTKLARKKGIPKRHIDGVFVKIAADNNATKVARLLSFVLRHGVLIKNIVAALDKVDSAYAGTFVFAVKKFLASYIKDGEKVEDERCMECDSTNIVFSEGCKKCMSCGSSKCG